MSVKTRIDILVEKIEKSLILLVGESGTAKEELGYRFIVDGIENDETIIAILFAHSSIEFVEELKKRSEKITQYLNAGKIYFIDALSFRSLPKEKLPNTTLLESVSDLLTLSVKINEISLKSSKLRIIFDQVSLLMLYNDPKQVLNFVQTLAARVRQRKQTALLIMDSGVIDEKIERALHSMADIMVETKRRDVAEGIKQLVRVKFAKYEYEPRWVEVI